MPVSVAKSQTTAWVVVICIYVAAFLRFPQEPAYLIPMLPFVILLLWRLLNRRLFIFVCIAILVSSFVSISPAGIAQGPIFADHSSRIEAIKSVEGFIAHENRLQQKSVIVTGHWYPKIEVYLFGKPHRIVEYVWLLDESLLQKYLNQAYNVYYLPGARESNRQTYGVDLAEYGAVQLIAQEKQE